MSVKLYVVSVDVCIGLEDTKEQICQCHCNNIPSCTQSLTRLLWITALSFSGNPFLFVFLTILSSLCMWLKPSMYLHKPLPPETKNISNNYTRLVCSKILISTSVATIYAASCKRKTKHFMQGLQFLNLEWFWQIEQSLGYMCTNRLWGS